MSTIKSSSEHLTLNADGSSRDIKFQANGVEKASISSAGAFTSTTIDATKLTGNLPAISGASLTNMDNTASVRVYKSGAQTIANGTVTTVTWDSETFDSDGLHHPSTNNSRLTAIVSGKYIVGATLTYSEVQDHHIAILLTKNGAYIAGHEQNTPTAGSNFHNGISVTTMIDLGAGDYVEVRTEQRRGSALDIITANPGNSFWMSRVGS